MFLNMFLRLNHNEIFYACCNESLDNEIFDNNKIGDINGKD